MSFLKCPTDLTIPELSDSKASYLQTAIRFPSASLEQMCCLILANQFDAKLKRRNSHLWGHGTRKPKTSKSGPKAPV